MKSRIIATFLLIYPLMISAQYKFRPIIDSTATCSFHKGLSVTRYFSPESPGKYTEEVALEYFYIVEKMPVPKNTLKQIEECLDREVSLNEQEKGLNGNLYFQCVINCEGKAGDFQIIYCPEEFVNIGCQVLNVLRDNLVMWEPGKQRGVDVDVLIKIRTSVINGKFKISSPVM